MLNSKDIKNIAKKISRHQKGLRDIEVMHPVREWYIGLTVALVLFLVSVAWSAAIYLENREVEVVEVDQSSVKTVVYRDEAVTQALAIFESKSAMRVSLLNSELFQPIVTLEEVASSTEEAELIATTSSSTIAE